MAENSIDHPLKVSAENEYVAPCGRTDCGKTGFGVLHIVEKEGRSTASLEFLGAFCTKGCNLGVGSEGPWDLPDYERVVPATPDGTHTTTVTALSRLGLAVDVFPLQSQVE